MSTASRRFGTEISNLSNGKKAKKSTSKNAFIKDVDVSFEQPSSSIEESKQSQTVAVEQNTSQKETSKTEVNELPKGDELSLSSRFQYDRDFLLQFKVRVH